MTFAPEVASDVGFRWQFRPVLGKAIGRAGLKQTFVQLSLPQLADVEDVADATMRMVWVKDDTRGAQSARSTRLPPHLSAAHHQTAEAGRGSGGVQRRAA